MKLSLVLSTEIGYIEACFNPLLQIHKRYSLKSSKRIKALIMSGENRRTIAKEMVDQSLSYFKEQRQNAALTQPQTHAQESERKPPKEFEPSANFSQVFSERVGKKTRPGLNVNLKENPRLISASDNSIPKSRDNQAKDTRQTHSQELEQKPPKEFEPSANFHRRFDDLMGKNQPSVKIRLKENPRLTGASGKHTENETEHV